MNNIKIGVKLIGGFLIVAMIAAAIGIFGVTNMKSADVRDTMLYEKATVPFEYVITMGNNFQRLRVNSRDIIRATTPEKVEQYAQRIKVLGDSLNIAAAQYEKTLITDAGKDVYKQFELAFNEYKGFLDQVVVLAKSQKDVEAYAILDGDAQKVNQLVQNLIDKIVEQKLGIAKKLSEENTVKANATMTIMVITLIVGVLIAIILGISLAVSITKPLSQGVTMMLEMAKGHLGTRLKMNRKDEIGQLATAMDEFAEDLQKNVVATVVKIGGGDVSSTLKPKDAQDEITPAIINTIESLKGLMAEAGMLSKAAIDGKLATRGQADKFKGGYKEIVQGVNDCLDSVIGPLNVAAEYVDRISKGDIPAKITDKYNGDFNEIKNNLNVCIDSVNALVADANMLSVAAVEGKLATRADASKHGGDFGKIVKGVNDCLDSVIGPLNVTAKYVDDISKGVIPPIITDNYNGDFNIIKGNLNSVVKMMSDLLKETDIIIKAAADGELDKRANASLFLGGWNQLVSGVNDTITNIVDPLMVTADYVEKVSKGVIPSEITTVYKGQYNIIKNNLNAVVKMMSELLTETNKLVQAALNGQLETRANAALFLGGWNQLVKGVNDTLDNVLVPINEAAQVLDKVAARDMTARVMGDYKGDLAKIKNSLNSAVDNLDMALSQVAEATGQVSSASQQISSGSQSLAQGANEQASSLEEVSSSLEEMASMTKQNAENANQAKTLSAEADTNAKVGTEAMSRMSDSINKIKESSDQTAKIVKTIDEIAMQTNLLALNAAVEAARAGEAGRGFAVVAEEVRNLAQRSAQAAKNTADMISESVKNAEGGVKIAGEVSMSFTAIATSAKKVNDLIAEIAAASQEQSQGIDQVNSAVAQMDKVTQSNAANSEESASAAEELSGQAEELSAMVGQFALSQATQNRSARPSAGAVHQTHADSKVAVHKKSTNGNGMAKKKLETVNANNLIPMDEAVLKDF